MASNAASGSRDERFAGEPARRRMWLLPTAAVLAMLGILWGSIDLGRRQLRQRIRDQIAHRDGEILEAVALMQQMQQAADAGDAGLTARLEDPAEQLTVLLEISRLKGVIAARLFDTNGQFVAGVPDTVTEAQLARDDLRVLGALKSVCRFRERASLADVLWDWGLEAESSASEVPLLEVHVPLHAAGDARLVGVAQFTIDGTSIAAEFEALDRHLHRQKILVFGVAGALVVAGLGWAFWRLARAQELLARRRDDLLRANNELALAAKHSALGAVAAHLVHGLRNPLAGLQLYLTRQATETAGSNGAETSEAVASTRRMQSLINDVVRVLREDRMAQRYEVRVVELCDTVRSRLLPAAREAEVSLVVEGQAEVSYTNREASLVLLILENLLDNAIQATPRGGEVRLRVDANRQHLTFEVTDHGPGLTEPIRASLFLPCRSTKAGGSGMGLAISRQLALALGGTLELRRSSIEGCSFGLTVPRAPTSDADRPEQA